MVEAPQERSLAADLALTHSNRGSFRSGQGRLSEAVESFRAAIVILERLHADGPGDKDAARDLAVSLNNLGMALQRLDDLAGSERSFRTAVAVLPMDTEDDPRRPADCSSRGESTTIWGWCCSGNNDPSKRSKRSIRRSLGRRRRAGRRQRWNAFGSC